MFDAILDGRTTIVCRSRNGITLPADDSFWLYNTPPLHHYCRSSIRGITATQAMERGITGIDGLPDAPPQDGFGYAPPVAGEGFVPSADGYSPDIWAALVARMNGQDQS